MDPRVDPALATDLSDVKDKQAAVDLSKEAIAQRERETALYRAGARARAMSRAFKGILGTRGRKGHIEYALRHEGLID